MMAQWEESPPVLREFVNSLHGVGFITAQACWSLKGRQAECMLLYHFLTLSDRD